MSKDTGSGGGLLSKMVKFVTSPTTHWSDLDRPSAEEGESESRLALKEMIERKRRNDFVRNREFDMLRKLRRREPVSGTEASPASLYPSAPPLQTAARTRTLEKIDAIEAQMATSWFKRHHDEAAPSAPASPTAAASSPAPADESSAYAATRPSALDPVTSDRAPLPHPSAPTSEPQASPESASAASAPAPMPAPQPPAAPAAVPAMVSFGGQDDFNVEVLIEARQDPEIEEAAIRFANGDTAGAEAGLLALLGEGAPRQDDVDTWLTLFDLYRASNQHAKFDDAALDFAARFGRSAPQWALITERTTAPAPMLPAATAVSVGLFHWVCPSTMGTQTVAALKATLARHAPPWRIDWRYVKSIDPAALPALIEELQRWADTPVRIKLLGADVLLQLLSEHSPTDQRDVDPKWWEARLALLRVLHEMDEFELVALNYCVTYEVSPPAWEEPKSSYSPMDEEGQTVRAGLGDDSTLSPAASSSFAFTQPPPAAGPALASDGVYKGELQGELLSSADEALKPLEQHPHAAAFELNCRRLQRVDFGAAGDLLNWAMANQAQGKAVTFKQVNRLVAAFFGVVGLNSAARILLRTD
ncbi:MAG: STAS domain-containing protein [Pseudomonadota bacterium]|nr:STAS domain-containing protein [Pseudomonadota bacterium]